MGRRKPRTQNATTRTSSSYNYKPLPTSNSSIRLLRLLPSPEPSFPLRCIIFNTSLSSVPSYTALSYTWGDATRTSSIFVSSSPSLTQPTTLLITYNLKHFLQRLRHSTTELVLWVDAICINQSDVSERSIQTTRMRDIYMRASRVAIWLGNAHGLSNGAVRIVRELNACQETEDVRNLINDPEKRGDIEALVMLFRRQYWWRVWVIQEVACGSSAVAYVGEESIPWENLDGVCNVLHSVEIELQRVFYKRPSWVRTLTHGGPRGLQLSRYDSEVKAPPLLEALLTHKSKKATDPRDKVFALLGISASMNTFGAVDYSQEVVEIYVYTTRHIVGTSGKLDVICVKQHDSPHILGLPTWVPDWTRPRHGAGATVLGLHHRTPAFKAAGETDAMVEFVTRSDGLVMRVKGVLLGRISAAGRPYKKRGAPSHVGPCIESFKSWWSLFISTLTDAPSIQDKLRFAHLLSCGTWASQSQAIISDRMSAAFAISSSRNTTNETLISRLDPSSRTSTASTMASSTSSLQDQDQDEDEETDELETVEDRERLAAMIAAGMMMNRRRIFLTESGVMGVAPWDAEVGDMVVVLFGCKFPVILKRCEDAMFELRGEAYVEDFMNGEAIAAHERGQLRLEEFEIE